MFLRSCTSHFFLDRRSINGQLYFLQSTREKNGYWEEKPPMTHAQAPSPRPPSLPLTQPLLTCPQTQNAGSYSLMARDIPSSKECTGPNCSIKRRVRNPACTYRLCVTCCLKHLEESLSATCSVHNVTPTTPTPPSFTAPRWFPPSPPLFPEMELSRSRSPLPLPLPAEMESYFGVGIVSDYHYSKMKVVLHELKRAYLIKQGREYMRKQIYLTYWKVWLPIHVIMRY